MMALERLGKQRAPWPQLLLGPRLGQELVGQQREAPVSTLRFVDSCLPSA